MAIVNGAWLSTPTSFDHEWLLLILTVFSVGATIEILGLLVTKGMASISGTSRLSRLSLRTRQALVIFFCVAAATVRWWESFCIASTTFTDNGVIVACRGDSCDDYRQHVWTCSYERELRLIEAMQRQLDDIAWIPLERAFQDWSLPAVQQLHASADFATIYDALRNRQLPDFIDSHGDRDDHKESNEAVRTDELWDFIAYESVEQLKQLEEECRDHQASTAGTKARLQEMLQESYVWLAEDDSCDVNQANSFCPTTFLEHFRPADYGHIRDKLGYCIQQLETLYGNPFSGVVHCSSDLLSQIQRDAWEYETSSRSKRSLERLVFSVHAWPQSCIRDQMGATMEVSYL